MPYKNVEERRLKQKLKKREQRLEGRQTICALSPLITNIDITSIHVDNELEDKIIKEEEGRQTIYALSPRPWTWTINGVVVPLSMTDAMPFAYQSHLE
jgi:hypothetical protein